MKNKEYGVGRKTDAAGFAIASLCAYSAFSFAVLLIFGKLIPSPLAEYMAFAYTYGKGGRTWLCVLFSVLFAAALILCALSFKKSLRERPYIAIPATLLVFADLAVQGYAFLAASGYQWIYLICAVLDGILVFCLLYRPANKNKKG